MIALPVLPPITEVQEQRLEFLTSAFGVSYYGMDCKERTSLIFLMQTHLFKKLTDNSTPNSKEYYNYLNQSIRNYEAYLYYNK